MDWNGSVEEATHCLHLPPLIVFILVKGLELMSTIHKLVNLLSLLAFNTCNVSTWSP